MQQGSEKYISRQRQLRPCSFAKVEILDSGDQCKIRLKSQRVLFNRFSENIGTSRYE